MTKYEVLVAEYDDRLAIEEHPMKLQGLYCDNVIWINKGLCQDRKLCILAEELGHYYTSAGDILSQDNVSNVKQEYKARAWAFDKLLPFEEFQRALKADCITIPDISEYLGVDEDFLKESIEHYKRKLGVEFPIFTKE